MQERGEDEGRGGGGRGEDELEMRPLSCLCICRRKGAVRAVSRDQTAGGRLEVNRMCVSFIVRGMSDCESDTVLLVREIERSNRTRSKTNLAHLLNSFHIASAYFWSEMESMRFTLIRSNDMVPKSKSKGDWFLTWEYIPFHGFHTWLLMKNDIEKWGGVPTLLHSVDPPPLIIAPVRSSHDFQVSGNNRFYSHVARYFHESQNLCNSCCRLPCVQETCVILLFT